MTGLPGYRARYGVNPYQGYDTRRGPMEWTFSGDTPAQLPRMERVVALHEGGESWAVPFSALKEEKVVQLEVEGKDVVVFFTPETVSALDAERISSSRSVGYSAVYE